jgi:hypothetical protein
MTPAPHFGHRTLWPTAFAGAFSLLPQVGHRRVMAILYLVRAQRVTFRKE